MDYTILTNELTNDPLARGYAGMTDQEVVDSLLTKNRPTERTVVPSYEIFDAIVPAEWAALTSQEKQRVQTILAMGSINIKGSNTRQSFLDAFAPGTTTRTNLAALQVGPNISRAEELGISDVGDGHVASARGG